MIESKTSDYDNFVFKLARLFLCKFLIAFVYLSFRERSVERLVELIRNKLGTSFVRSHVTLASTCATFKLQIDRGRLVLHPLAHFT